MQFLKSRYIDLMPKQGHETRVNNYKFEYTKQYNK